MKWSKYFIPTQKQAPKEAETISHKLLIRAGLIDKLSAGVYTYLPLGLKVLRKIENIIREEMNKAGAIELLMPALQPSSLWKESERLDKMGKDMIRFIDRHGREMIFGPTHEEVITDIIRRYIKSWKQLPIILYQIQTKFRDEIRPRFAIIRAREFLMKDAYSFDLDEKGLDKSYNLMKETYIKIFKRCGLNFTIREAESGVIGGKFSEEFVAEGECSELEVGHIFKLGLEYSKSMKAYFLDKDNQEKPIYMGCYGIGVSRIVAAIIEGNYDKNGIIWPFSISPFLVDIIPINMTDSGIVNISEKVYNQLKSNNISVIIDDREESAGVKFKDADLCGFPIQIIVGKKIKDKKLEVKKRKDGEIVEIAIDKVLDYINSLVELESVRI
ncbi:MAG: proline--tRNA ligase [Candidatus Omnitrophica bacterium]|nr:proline--tRNA ligase [Candidatus Omnitrophota bacterium]MCM8809567.1 proline--tRNA ligase [Candidatus Omnitrophota bacterium]MCM8810540.1 proline--tRNA ligase [Candidatus Omnitrophota bacterium]MCM8832827.1 proline--tRNA ligase [Candidatus Omnitrophota bacterium]